RFGRGTVLRSLVDAPLYDSQAREEVPVVQIASVVDERGLSVFALNRDPSGQPVRLSGTLRDFPAARSASHQVLSHPDLKAVNSAAQPENVTPRMAEEAPVVDGGTFAAVLPSYSWNVIRFEF
ncbi:MAG TPA: alpha-L-arabinofuranosidase C-terminal domain-containing protein, partial [Armatimonadota bacterium]|nr:alpha-L-arabinofuranosidase C-terminal domain-containing protein [Armatimonadota bacterium]